MLGNWGEENAWEQCYSVGALKLTVPCCHCSVPRTSRCSSWRPSGVPVYDASLGPSMLLPVREEEGERREGDGRREEGGREGGGEGGREGGREEGREGGREGEREGGREGGGREGGGERGREGEREGGREGGGREGGGRKGGREEGC